MGKIIVLYYSSNGKTAELARHVRSGILEEGNNEPLFCERWHLLIKIK